MLSLGLNYLYGVLFLLEGFQRVENKEVWTMVLENLCDLFSEAVLSTLSQGWGWFFSPLLFVVQDVCKKESFHCCVVQGISRTV